MKRLVAVLGVVGVLALTACGVTLPQSRDDVDTTGLTRLEATYQFCLVEEQSQAHCDSELDRLGEADFLEVYQ